MTSPTDATKLAAEGVPIPTRRGALPLLYGFRALRALEDLHGSVAAVQDAMEDVQRNLGDDGKGKAFGPLADIIVPGLLHTGLTRDQAEDCLQPAHLREYVNAMYVALQLAFPDAPADGPGNGSSPAPSGPGLSGTTSPPAGTAGPTSSSGA